MTTVSFRNGFRGYLLIEMLVTIAIIGVALLLQARLFQASMKLVRSEPVAANEMISLNHLTNQFRRDVWGAGEIGAPDEKTVTLSLPESRTIRWTFDSTAITRIDSTDPATAAPQRWEIPLLLKPHRQGAYIVLESSNTRNGASVGQRRFVSQVLLAQSRQEAVQ